LYFVIIGLCTRSVTPRSTDDLEPLVALLVALGATFVVGLGAPQWVLTVALGYVAIASFITVIQRVWTVYRQTQRTGEPA